MNNINISKRTQKYDLAIVTLFNILGFKELIETTKDDDIFQIYLMLSSFHWGHQAGWNTHNAMFKFADTLVRVIYLSENDNHHIKQLNEEVLTVSSIVNSLFISHGILVRGGMTIGEIYAKPQHNILFGPAMNRAYELESKIALWPRIIVDKYKEMIYINRDSEDRLSQFYPHTWNVWPFVEKEGDLYYIANIRNGSYDLQKERIVYGLNLHKNEKRIYEKYIWMMNEHNAGISKRIEHGDNELEEFIISEYE